MLVLSVSSSRGPSSIVPGFTHVYQHCRRRYARPEQALSGQSDDEGRLPLHSALVPYGKRRWKQRQEPAAAAVCCRIAQALLEAFPRGASCVTKEGMLPLHLLVADSSIMTRAPTRAPCHASLAAGYSP